MPPALLENASPPSQTPFQNRSRKMDVAIDHRSKDRDPAIYPTDSESVATKKIKPHKRSFDYVWRTGLAGGLAGCAVC